MPKSKVASKRHTPKGRMVDITHAQVVTNGLVRRAKSGAYAEGHRDGYIASQIALGSFLGLLNGIWNPNAGAVVEEPVLEEAGA